MSAGQPIVIPANGWRPRQYQLGLWKYLEKGGKRAVAVWHRRAGKDELCLHWTARAAMQRVGTYWHMLPEYKQARKAIWNAINPHTGRRRIDEVFPRQLRKRTNDQEMFIELVNGSTWQLIGSDAYDTNVGAPPVGVVFSEWALADPAAWAYIRPILLENDGWALFISTPRGRNHLATLYDHARDDQHWFGERLSADQTGVFSREDLERELAEYKRELGADDGEAKFRQEYLTDFTAAIPGAFYGHEMRAAEDEGRLTTVEYDPDLPTYTAWDIGRTDDTAIWVFQTAPRELRLIDFHVSHGAHVGFYVDWLLKQGYRYDAHLLPHDAKPKTFATGRSIIEHAQDQGLENIRIVPQMAVEDGINAVRSVLPRCWFDQDKCQHGIEALREYRREWDDENKVFRKNPLHNWASHPADAFRYLALGYREMVVPKSEPPPNPLKTPTFSDLDRVASKQASRRRNRV